MAQDLDTNHPVTLYACCCGVRIVHCGAHAWCVLYVVPLPYKVYVYTYKRQTTPIKDGGGGMPRNICTSATVYPTTQ